MKHNIMLKGLSSKSKEGQDSSTLKKTEIQADAGKSQGLVVPEPSLQDTHIR